MWNLQLEKGRQFLSKRWLNWSKFPTFNIIKRYIVLFDTMHLSVITKVHTEENKLV